MSEKIAEIFTLDEVAKYLKVGKRTIYRLTAEKKIPAFKGGAHGVYPSGYRHWIRQRSTATRCWRQILILPRKGVQALPAFAVHDMGGRNEQGQ